MILDEHIKFAGSPAFEHRAYLLDLSRNRVPTLDTLGWLIDILAELRYTELQLYMEHTYAYSGHDDVWKDASPLTRDELTWVCDRAAGAGLSLVPALNCFGHMESWLRHDKYRSRAECPDGYQMLHKDGIAPPSCLAPTPENALFVVELARELHGVIGSERIMIGGDEPFELGLGQSQAEASRIGLSELYRRHLKRIVEPLVDDEIEVMIWGDQFRRDRAAIEWIPDGVTTVPWNYEAPGRSWLGQLPIEFEERLGLPDDAELGFDAHVRLLSNGGAPFRVAAGTSTWGTLIGRNGNATANITDAVNVGVRNNATGFVLCDWGDFGHWQPLAISLPSIIRAGVIAWNGPTGGPVVGGEYQNRHHDFDLGVGSTIDRLLGAKPGTGDLLDQLGHIGESLGAWTPNGTPIGAAVFDSLFQTVGSVAQSSIQSATEFVNDAQGQWPHLLPSSERGQIIAAELAAICQAARLALGRLAKYPTSAQELRELKRVQSTAWLGSSRPGGLEASLDAYQ